MAKEGAAMASLGPEPFLPYAKTLCKQETKAILVDARQRNKRNGRMEAAETGWLQVGAHSGSAHFTGKLIKSTLRLRGLHFVYEKAVQIKPQNKKHLIR
jgi:hypothetical protein